MMQEPVSSKRYGLFVYARKFGVRAHFDANSGSEHFLWELLFVVSKASLLRAAERHRWARGQDAARKLAAGTLPKKVL
jgi:hypothetical protein